MIHVAIFDPAPAVCRLDHYDVPSSDAPRPMGSGPMTHVVDLIPFPPLPWTGEQTARFTATTLPLLADALAKMAERFPETASRPVWATLPPDAIAEVGRAVPGTRAEGRYIWMNRLDAAARAFGRFRRDFPDLRREDVDAVLPLYQAAYSPQLEREVMERSLFGDPT